SCRPNLVTDDIEKAPTPDLVIMGVKSWQLSAAAQKIAPILNENSLILPLQNGVDNPNKIMAHIDAKHVLSGFCNLISFIEAPGVVCHFAFPPTLTFRELGSSTQDSNMSMYDVVSHATV